MLCNTNSIQSSVLHSVTLPWSSTLTRILTGYSPISIVNTAILSPQTNNNKNERFFCCVLKNPRQFSSSSQPWFQLHMDQARLGDRKHMAQSANKCIGFGEADDGNNAAYCTNNIRQTAVPRYDNCRHWEYGHYGRRMTSSPAIF